MVRVASAAVVVVEGASLLPLPLVAVAVVRSTKSPALPGTSMVEVNEGVADATCRAVVGRN